MKAQREVFERVISLERHELELSSPTTNSASWRRSTGKGLPPDLVGWLLGFGATG
jgi:hypothetical protein